MAKQDFNNQIAEDRADLTTSKIKKEVKPASEDKDIQFADFWKSKRQESTSIKETVKVENIVVPEKGDHALHAMIVDEAAKKKKDNDGKSKKKDS